jgi:AraC-like DNA-binding protein
VTRLPDRRPSLARATEASHPGRDPRLTRPLASGVCSLQPVRAPPSTSEPGISSVITRAVLQELEARGIPADPLLERRGLLRETVLDLDGWIPLRRHRAFYRDAMEASGDPLFQIAVGRRVPVQVTRAAGYCASVSATVREAITAFGRFSELVVDGSKIGARTTETFDGVHARRPPASKLPEDGPSFAIGVIDFLAYATGKPVVPTEILMTGLAPASATALTSALGAPITWNADDFEIRFPLGTLDAPINHSNPSLRNALEEISDREVKVRTGRTAVERVRAAILELGFDRSATVAPVADRLGTTPRTLQRWLANESRTFSDLREEALRDAAVKMLGEKGAGVEEVALRLGFSSRSGFHRAIGRWTGRTPGAIRAKASRRSRS